MNAYWSIEECGWVAVPEGVAPYWSVQRCRWEPVGAETEDLPTPWSMLRAAPAVPEQRLPAAAVVDA